ncbi:PadR family transcriptional regulator [Streptomyces noursei ZPM]|uniref:PadR family transcriptional regulator n=1 Tax=Streptomyces noursei TaxID=1971 RepID=A0A059WF25_STRNR|nr:PadR family transcriptional regulator [Streptomyces noursei]AKA06405.1 PadR family transcriptional regulator [Streptomyces noursei ZPM]EOT05969.1 PadR family transcriptional regulator [Streptomyces noursei CCRC 11814]GCB94124.1 PadR family transcriptional regulator [Streptomyces noursei]
MVCVAHYGVFVSVEELTLAQAHELRRGTVVLACLALLREPSYGYALLETLNGAGVSVDGNTLYPLLRRLEKQGLLTSEWNTDESRPRKFYRVSPDGSLVLAGLVREWQDLSATIARLTKENG